MKKRGPCVDVNTRISSHFFTSRNGISQMGPDVFNSRWGMPRTCIECCFCGLASKQKWNTHKLGQQADIIQFGWPTPLSLGIGDNIWRKWWRKWHWTTFSARNALVAMINESFNSGLDIEGRRLIIVDRRCAVLVDEQHRPGCKMRECKKRKEENWKYKNEKWKTKKDKKWKKKNTKNKNKKKNNC